MIGLALAAALALSPLTGIGAPPLPTEIMVVPPELRAILQEQVLDKTRNKSQRLELLVGMMSKSSLDIQYHDDATQTVAQSFQSRQANCLTHTLMFLALAREAGLNAYPQEIEETLAWHQEDGIVYRTSHVNAGINIGTRRYVVDVGSSFIIGRRPAKQVSQSRLLAHYYNNRAAQLLAEGNLPLALAHAEIAISLDATFPTTWSNTGVLYLRNGDRSAAEQAYLRALALKPTHTGALFNLIGLYERTGDRVRAAEMRARLDKLQSTDPFHEFLRGVEFENIGDGPNAVSSYRRVIAVLGNEHRFHYRLSRAYLLTGNQRAARHALQRALALCGNDPVCAQYQVELNALRSD